MIAYGDARESTTTQSSGAPLFAGDTLTTDATQTGSIAFIGSPSLARFETGTTLALARGTLSGH